MTARPKAFRGLTMVDALLRIYCGVKSYLGNARVPDRHRRAGISKKLLLEELEIRISPATDTFINPAGGEWYTASNWSLGRSPINGDDVVIPSLSPGATVNYIFTPLVTINSLSLNSTLSLAFGLTVSGSVTGSGTILVSGGELSDATVAAGVTVETSPTSEFNELDNLTIDGQLIILGGTGISNGLTLNGACEIGNQQYGGILTFNTNDTLNGTGTVSFGNPNLNPTITISNFKNPNPTLTIGPGITVLGAGGSLGDVLDNIVNEGTIKANGSNGVVKLGASLTEAPTGTLEVDIGPSPSNSPFPRFEFGGYSLAGTLQANYVNGYSPSAGLRYWIIGGSGTEGTFANVIGGQAIYQEPNVYLTTAAQAQIAPTSLVWDTTKGGVDFGFQVSNGAVPKNTEVALYWSSSNQFSGAIGSSVYTENIPAGTAIGSYGPFNVPVSDLGTAPQGASYLLAVTDPNNVLGNFNPSTNVIALAYNPPTITTTTVFASPNPSAYGQPVTLTATVAPASSGNGTPTGTVTFMDGSTVLNPEGTALDSKGAATFTTSALPVGPQSITAVYSGDSNFTVSTSSPINQIVAYTPQQIDQSYGINLIQFGSTIAPLAGNGLGQTIAIIDYGDDPTIASDLATFDSEFGLPAPPSFKEVGETGGPSPVYSQPSANPVNPTETAGDVEWAHAIAPDANIVLIELQNKTVTDIATAITTAVPGVNASVVSMSFGGPEFPGETSNATTVSQSISASPTGATESGNTVTISVPAGLYCYPGNLVTISGVGVAGYNGTFPLASVITSPAGYAVSFTYTDPVSGLAPSGSGTAAVPTYDDGIFTEPGVTYVASSGDNGQPPTYPAVSPNVIGVGAMNLYLNANGSWQSETGWGNPVITNATESGNTVTIALSDATPSAFAMNSAITVSGVGEAGYNGTFQIASVSPGSNGYTASLTYMDPNAAGLAPSSGGTVTGSNNGGSGGGISAYETEPSYQTSAFATNPSYYGLLNPQSTNSMRANPDVSFIGGTLTPVCIVVNGSLTTFGGTSLAAPCWAGMIAIANQGLANAGAPLLTSTTALANLYKLPSTDFHDITTGFNGYYASKGYDYVSGIGTPIANTLIPDLVNLAGISAVGHATIPTPILQNAATGSVLLATFTQGAFTQSATSYSATVAWGDGSIDTTAETNSPLSIVVTGQTIQVFGSHAFTTSGTLTIGIAINGPGGASGRAYATADIASAVSPSVSVTRSGLTYNRSTKLFYGTLTLTSNGATTLSGSLDVLLQGLTQSASLEFASITINGTTYSLPIVLDSVGDPYIHVSQSLLSLFPLGPKKSLTISIEFSDPSLALIGYNPDVFSDPFDS